MKTKYIIASALGAALCLAAYVHAVTPDSDQDKRTQEQKANKDLEPKSAQPAISEPSGAATKGQFGSKAQISSEATKDLNKSSHLIGSTIRNQQGEQLGRIKDVVLDLDSGKIAYFVVQKSGGAAEAATASSGDLVAIPLGAFKSSTDGQSLVVNIDRTKFDTAQTFTESSWPMLSAPGEQATFWGSSVSEPAGAAPDQQKEQREQQQPGAPEKQEQPKSDQSEQPKAGEPKP